MWAIECIKLTIPPLPHLCTILGGEWYSMGVRVGNTMHEINHSPLPRLRALGMRTPILYYSGWGEWYSMGVRVGNRMH